MHRSAYPRPRMSACVWVHDNLNGEEIKGGDFHEVKRPCEEQNISVKPEYFNRNVATKNISISDNM